MGQLGSNWINQNLLSLQISRHQGEFIKLVVAKVIRELKKSYLEMGTVLVGIEDRAEELVKKLEVGIDYHVQLEPQDYATVEEGINVLKESLRQKKVLILLDDVDHINQIKVLAADVGWFGRGSRIIITTREKDVLEQFQEQDLYEVPLLDEGHALELFCMHAFRNKSPRPDLVEEALQIVNITGRLPLALEVMGSFLSVYGGKKDMWHATIEKLKFKLDMFDIQDKLKISYESLECEQKEIFLDIACFFIGMDVRLVIPMWKDAKLSPEVGIEILQLKSLIKIGEDNTIWMHDQLKDLGRSTVEQQDRELGRRSRLWHGEDAFDVLVEQQFGSKLKVLSLKKCRIRRTPDFSAFLSLESLILESCELLSWVDPSIGLLKNLILLNLRKCRSLEKLPEELGSMESLVEFLIDETRVAEVPISRGMKKLEVLSANSCRNLREIPASIGSLENLRRLSLSRSGIEELPNSFGQLTSLVELILTETNIGRLPDFVGDLHDLELLKIDNTYVSCLPGNLGSLKKLKVLDASSPKWGVGDQIISDEILSLSSMRVLKLSRVKSLPAGMSTLSCLETLHLGHCQNLQTLPELPSSLTSLVVPDLSKLTSVNLANLVNLKELHLSEGSELEELESVSCLRKLEKMTLSYLKMSTIQEEIGASLRRLKELDIHHCHVLKSLPMLPSSLSALRIGNCNSLEKLPDISNLKNLSILCVFDCPKLSEIEGLGNLLPLRELVTDGCPLTKLDDLERLKSLAALSIARSEVERLPDLSMLKNLKSLNVAYCRKLAEIRGLSRLHNLKWVFIDSCVSLDRLPELPYSMEKLYLRGCEQFREIEAVAELDLLQVLDISGCKSLRKLPNLSKLQRLESIVMKECENVTEIPGLEELSNLRRLSIFGCWALKLPDLSKQQDHGLQIYKNQFGSIFDRFL
ncbi:hypothetical protein CRG98_041057 [Punica granatum]|uniref:Uncharacterized protein n=1 Tax=Punica granatum TaxID=22663 RepID=A0A2I0I3R1_PUNGR|nr:hypothetical protein CRG98_041057 [Punica granatum]